MVNVPKEYEALLERSKQLAVLGSAGAILQWDMETKMPPKGINLRSQQMALLSVMGHRMLTDPEVGRLIEASEKSKNLGEAEKRNIWLAKKAYGEATKLPERLVFETEKQRTVSTGAWKKAKASNDWKSFKPELEKMIELRKEAAGLLMDVKGAKNPYDALIDDFESQMTQARITEVFDEMKTGLIDIIKRVKKSKVKPDTGILSRKVPVETQKLISDFAMEYVGYDVKSPKSGGRLDETEHPFTTGYYDDVRITTHYHEDRWISSLYSVLHEAGHAIYEQNLPQGWIYQPIGGASSSGIHESQSRFYENMVGRSPEFWAYAMPKLKKIVGKPLRGVSTKEMVAAVNLVQPSKIRIEADEVTYGLHIIIRFEMERDIFAGKLKVSELPEVWNQKYEDYLGVKIKSDSEGVMQDTHWGSGLYGYFPSYALGNLYGGMFLKKMKKEAPGWQKSVKAGDVAPAKQWMAEHVYAKGNLYNPEDLVKHATGKKLTVKPFLDYVNAKVKKIYGV
jgi:carboxypeptidase Taq